MARVATLVALTHKWGVVGGNVNPVCMHIHVLLDFSLTLKAACHECVIRTGQP